MEPVLILSFLGTSMLLTLFPGPDVLYVLTESAVNGFKTGIAIALGLATGLLLHTLLATTGLSIIVYESELAFRIVKYLGAAYLFYLAYLAALEKKSVITQTIIETDKSFQLFTFYRKGFIMNILDPKVPVFFIAIVPNFISANGWRPLYQMMVLDALFIVQAMLIFSTLSLLSGQITIYFQKDKFWEITKWLKMVAFLIIGFILLFT